MVGYVDQDMRTNEEFLSLNVLLFIFFSRLQINNFNQKKNFEKTDGSKKKALLI